eukprot:344218-Pyramimonas_sp.AAC.1
MRLRTCTIAVGMINLVGSIGVSGENASRLRAAAEFVSALAVPWVLMWDFHVAPELLEESRFLEAVRGRTIVPDSVSFTCDVGETMIDYVVCSESVLSYVSVSADARSPFKTRACLDVALDFEALSSPVCQRRAPLRFPEAFGPDNC